jgi:hypothetical protein
MADMVRLAGSPTPTRMTRSGLRGGSAFRPYCANLVSRFPYFVDRAVENCNRTATCNHVLVGIGTDGQKKREASDVIAKLRACVRTYAPAARAAAMQNTGNAINFLVETCSPPMKVSDLTSPGATPSPQSGALSLSDLANAGAIPPGLFRRVVSEEWADIVDQTRTH